ncbi:MAG: hypothetical protein WAO00_16725 [Chthoniobacterales bacterium]
MPKFTTESANASQSASRVPQSGFTLDAMNSAEILRRTPYFPRLRKYRITIIGLVFLLMAIGLFVADRTGLYELSNGLPVWGLVLFALICIIIDAMKRHLFVGVGAAILLALVTGLAIGALVTEPKERPPRSFDRREYCLLTWEGRSANVCFKLVHNFEASRAIHSWTSKWGATCGVSELKQALCSLPEGSYVFWYTWPSKFDYPQSLDTDELIAVAKGKGVNLQLTPAMQ